MKFGTKYVVRCSLPFYVLQFLFHLFENASRILHQPVYFQTCSELQGRDRLDMELNLGFPSRCWEAKHLSHCLPPLRVCISRKLVSRVELGVKPKYCNCTWMFQMVISSLGCLSPFLIFRSELGTVLGALVYLIFLINSFDNPNFQQVRNPSIFYHLAQRDTCVP